MWLKNTPKPHWSDEFVYKLTQKNAINVSENGTVNIEKKMTRAEFSAIALKYFGLKPIDLKTLDRTKVFSDLALNHKSATAIYTLVENNIIKGYSDGQFYPNKQMTTGEGGMIVTNDKGNG